MAAAASVTVTGVAAVTAWNRVYAEGDIEGCRTGGEGLVGKIRLCYLCSLAGVFLDVPV